MTYAAKAKVPVDRSKTEIERTLARYGADRFAYFTEAGKAVIVFEARDRRLRFDLPLPAGESEKDAQGRRQRWRALLLCIKNAPPSWPCCSRPVDQCGCSKSLMQQG
jgi:hypothetical protein